MGKTGKRIPIKDAQEIGNKHGYSQVIVVAWDAESGTTSVCTWGKSLKDCEQAAEGGNFVKKALGWPDELCKDKPARIRKEAKNELLGVVPALEPVEGSAWVCTDPDTDQWGRQISWAGFEFKTGDSEPVVIDLTKYTKEQWYKYLSAYYSGSPEEISKELGGYFAWITAECIYEIDFEGK